MQKICGRCGIPVDLCAVWSQCCKFRVVTTGNWSGYVLIVMKDEWEDGFALSVRMKAGDGSSQPAVGSRCCVTGEMKLRPDHRSSVAEGIPVLKPILIGESVDIINRLGNRPSAHQPSTASNSDPEWPRDRFLRAVCGGIEVDPLVRKAIALSLIGANKACRRGDIHLLLHGPPGSGKTAVLRSVHDRVFTNCSNTTTAGLVGGLSRDPIRGCYVIEPGVLCRADGKTCAIDDIDRLEPSDQACLYEVMEQQTISMHKAGVSQNMNVRLSVIASANSTEKLTPMLLSRFDLCLILRGLPLETVTRSIIASRYGGNVPHMSDTEINHFLARAKGIPVSFSDEVKHQLKKFYGLLRNLSLDIELTPRLIEAMMRLCAASARLSGHSAVEDDDVLLTVELVATSIHSRLGPIGKERFRREMRKVFIDLPH